MKGGRQTAGANDGGAEGRTCRTPDLTNSEAAVRLKSVNDEGRETPGMMTTRISRHSALSTSTRFGTFAGRQFRGTSSPLFGIPVVSRRPWPFAVQYPALFSLSFTVETSLAVT